MPFLYLCNFKTSCWVATCLRVSSILLMLGELSQLTPMNCQWFLGSPSSNDNSLLFTGRSWKYPMRKGIWEGCFNCSFSTSKIKKTWDYSHICSLQNRTSFKCNTGSAHQNSHWVVLHTLIMHHHFLAEILGKSLHAWKFNFIHVLTFAGIWVEYLILNLWWISYFTNLLASIPLWWMFMI